MHMPVMGAVLLALAAGAGRTTAPVQDSDRFIVLCEFQVWADAAGPHVFKALNKRYIERGSSHVFQLYPHYDYYVWEAERTKHWVDEAVALGAFNVFCMGDDTRTAKGHLFTYEGLSPTFRKFLFEVIAYAHERGLMVAIEPVRLPPIKDREHLVPWLASWLGPDVPRESRADIIKLSLEWFEAYGSNVALADDVEAFFTACAEVNPDVLIYVDSIGGKWRQPQPFHKWLLHRYPQTIISHYLNTDQVPAFRAIGARNMMVQINPCELAGRGGQFFIYHDETVAFLKDVVAKRVRYLSLAGANFGYSRYNFDMLLDVVRPHLDLAPDLARLRASLVPSVVSEAPDKDTVRAGLAKDREAALAALPPRPPLSEQASSKWHAWRKSRRRFPIAAWAYFSRFGGTREEYQRYADANLTMVQVPVDQVDAAKAAGLDLIIASGENLHGDDHRAWWPFVNFPDREDRCVSMYDLVDEPRPEEFEPLRRLCDYLYLHDRRDAIPLIDLFPNWAVPKSRFGFDYETYVRRFIETVCPAVLLHCHYPIVADGSTRESWYANLELFRDEALKHDIGLMGFVLVTPHGSEKRPAARYRAPSESDLAWQVYSHLAYGAKGIWYYNYRIDEKGFGDGLVTGKTGEPTPRYAMVRDLNAELLGLGPTLLRLRSTSVCHTGLAVPEGCERCGDGKVRGVSGFVGDDFLIGTFEDADEPSDDVYLLVVNKRHGAGQPCDALRTAASITPAGRYRYVYQYDAASGKPVRMSMERAVTVSLGGGRGVLLRLRTSPLESAAP